MADPIVQKNGPRNNTIPLPTADEIRRVLDYDPESGVFRWKVRPTNCVKVGAIAGSIDKVYWRIKVNNIIYLAHRLAMVLITGEPIPEGMEVDHINGIRDDNRAINLRLVNHSQQRQNTKVNRNNRLGVKGVSRKYNGFAAHIKINGKQYGSPTVHTLEQAIELRKDLEARYHTHAPGKKTTETLAQNHDIAYNTQRTTD